MYGVKSTSILSKFPEWLEEEIDIKRGIIINALGEGQVLICDEGGNINTGDYICTSSIEGHGMKQDDDLLHNYTVAKAMESIDFTDNEGPRLIACTYHCG